MPIPCCSDTRQRKNPRTVVIHALDFTALLLLVGLALAFHRRSHDLALIAVQRFRFDLAPLVLLLAIVITGLALTAGRACSPAALPD